ncbi:hypothetical protein X975_23997, partial [Stegodyphus mimosarum]
MRNELLYHWYDHSVNNYKMFILFNHMSIWKKEFLKDCL